MMRPFIRDVVATIRTAAAVRWTAVRQLRRQTRTVLAERRARRQQSARRWRVPLRAGAVRAAAETGLESEVLRVIACHPEGVRAFDIGNEIGIDWRRVPAIAGKLVEQAIVEQVDHQFYPVEKVR
jgi:hypothetical protein